MLCELIQWKNKIYLPTYAFELLVISTLGEGKWETFPCNLLKNIQENQERTVYH